MVRPLPELPELPELPKLPELPELPAPSLLSSSEIERSPLPSLSMSIGEPESREIGDESGDDGREDPESSGDEGLLGE